MNAFDPYYKWLGVPPDEQPPNHYRLLGIRLFEADADVIDAAANRQMAYLQQCATGPHCQESQNLLNELSATRVCLLSAASKAEYDAELRRELPSPVHVEFAAVESRPRLTVVSFMAIFIALAAAIFVFVLNRNSQGFLHNEEIWHGDSDGPAGVPGKEQVKPHEQQVRLRADIDGRDELRVYQTVANWVHRGSIWPSNVEFNGMAWTPKTTREIANSGETHYLDAGADFSKATLEIVRGRGAIVFRKFADSVYVHFDDSEHGRDTYEIVLHFPKR
jgi:hypothetical protein